MKEDNTFVLQNCKQITCFVFEIVDRLVEKHTKNHVRKQKQTRTLVQTYIINQSEQQLYQFLSNSSAYLEQTCED